jgi:hypothetical protein
MTFQIALRYYKHGWKVISDVGWKSIYRKTYVWLYVFVLNVNKEMSQKSENVICRDEPGGKRPTSCCVCVRTIKRSGRFGCHLHVPKYPHR